ncbi:hypothetical protein [Veronia pacifica]|uniref:Outer membrane protein beta-barrel domain-containing protein n=1 Tax=Veronia pacifica TaxID=1080227 RepID=A0A1C3EKL1_9GAMM|nr:hypothetical protein [Veronia pacifica]ODA33776.1 hypothetical protein A8L45_09100 [Veronia pacifica]
MQIFKNIVIVTSLSVIPLSVSNAYENVIGISVGSPGYTISYNRENFRISAGFEEFHAGLDLLWNVEWAGTLGGYSYTGAQWLDETDKEWGIKTGLGISVPLVGTNAECFGEFGPVWYGQNRSDIEFEGSFGVRLMF